MHNKKRAALLRAASTDGDPATWRSPHFSLNDLGFSMIELMAVILVLAALALLTIPSMTALADRARVARCKEEIRTIDSDIAAFIAEKGILPTSLGDVHRSGMVDPWGHEYVYTPPALADDDHPRRTFGIFLSDDYDLYSKGKNGLTTADVDTPQSNDDIVRSGNGTFVGLVSELNDF